MRAVRETESWQKRKGGKCRVDFTQQLRREVTPLCSICDRRFHLSRGQPLPKMLLRPSSAMGWPRIHNKPLPLGHSSIEQKAEDELQHVLSSVSPSRACNASDVFELNFLEAFAPPKSSFAISAKKSRSPLEPPSPTRAKSQLATLGSAATSSVLTSELFDCFGEKIKMGLHVNQRSHENAFFTFSGEYAKNKKNGQGVLTMADGSSIVGIFEDGEMTGKGYKFYPDGSSYEGEFRKGEAHGIGKYVAATGGVRYSGEFREGYFCGAGRWTKGSNERYVGQFEKSTFCGEGVYEKDGEMHIAGHFLNGKPHGMAVARHLKTKDIYEGEFFEGVEQGTGIFTSSLTGIVYNGEFAAGFRTRVPNAVLLTALKVGGKPVEELPLFPSALPPHARSASEMYIPVPWSSPIVVSVALGVAPELQLQSSAAQQNSDLLFVPQRKGRRTSLGVSVRGRSISPPISPSHQYLQCTQGKKDFGVVHQRNETGRILQLATLRSYETGALPIHVTPENGATSEKMFTEQITAEDVHSCYSKVASEGLPTRSYAPKKSFASAAGSTLRGTQTSILFNTIKLSSSEEMEKDDALVPFGTDERRFSHFLSKQTKDGSATFVVRFPPQLDPGEYVLSISASNVIALRPGGSTVSEPEVAPAIVPIKLLPAERGASLSVCSPSAPRGSVSPSASGLGFEF